MRNQPLPLYLQMRPLRRQLHKPWRQHLRHGHLGHRSTSPLMTGHSQRRRSASSRCWNAMACKRHFLFSVSSQRSIPRSFRWRKPPGMRSEITPGITAI